MIIRNTVGEKMYQHSRLTKFNPSTSMYKRLKRKRPLKAKKHIFLFDLNRKKKKLGLTYIYHFMIKQQNNKINIGWFLFAAGVKPFSESKRGKVTQPKDQILTPLCLSSFQA